MYLHCVTITGLVNAIALQSCMAGSPLLYGRVGKYERNTACVYLRLNQMNNPFTLVT